MIRVLVIYTTPQLQLHDAAGEPYIDPTQRALQLVESMGTHRSSVDGEVPNIELQLRNDNGEATAALRRPPLGAEAAIFGVVGGMLVEQMRGVVYRVSLGETASIEVRA